MVTAPHDPLRGEPAGITWGTSIELVAMVLGIVIALALLWLA